jgi:hypothetical protein
MVKRALSRVETKQSGAVSGKLPWKTSLLFIVCASLDLWGLTLWGMLKVF